MTVNDDRLAAWIHGALEGDDAAAVAAEVAGDPHLADRAAQIRRLDGLVREAFPASEALPDALLARLGLPTSTNSGEVVEIAEFRAAADRAATRQTRWATGFLGSGWKVAAQVAIVVTAGFAAYQWHSERNPSEPDAAYRTLGDAPAASVSANALVVFARGTSPSQQQAMATRVGAVLVGEPTATGARRLSVDPRHRDGVLEQLRQMDGVTMAEPLEGAAP